MRGIYKGRRDGTRCRKRAGGGGERGQGGWLDGRLAPPVDGTIFGGASAGELTVAAGGWKGSGGRDEDGSRKGRDGNGAVVGTRRGTRWTGERVDRRS